MLEQAQVMTGAPPQARPEGAPVIPEFEILPMKGLFLVAAVFIGLVAAITANKLWALDFFHVVGGGMWTAVDLFVGLIIGPILGSLVRAGAHRVRDALHAQDAAAHADARNRDPVGRLAAGESHRRYRRAYPNHWWLTASYIVVGIMAVIALGILEPANLAVLFELKKPRPTASSSAN